MGDPASSPELRGSIKPARERFEGALRALFAAQPGTVRLAPDASRVFFDRCRALRGETEAVGAMSEPMAGHVAKHAGLMARVALTMHALEHGDMAREVLLDAATMQCAERLLRTIARHALAMFDMLAGDSGSALALARAVGRAIVAGQFEDVTRHNLIQCCRAYRDASEQARVRAAVSGGCRLAHAIRSGPGVCGAPCSVRRASGRACPIRCRGRRAQGTPRGCP